MDIFKKILIPISSEFFSDSIVMRVGELIKKFNSNVTVLYIIELKTLRKMEHISEAFLTNTQRNDMQENIITENKILAEKIIFERVKPVITNFEKNIVVGEFSEAVQKASADYGATCVTTTYEKDSLLKYKLFEQMTIPVWIEMKKGGERVLGICSNLSPNERVPDMTINLANSFGYKPHILYILDTKEHVEVDANGKKTASHHKELITKASAFLKKYESQAEIHFISGSFVEEIVRNTHQINPDIVIIGREMKRRNIFSRDVKKNIVSKLHHSLLFLN